MSGHTPAPWHREMDYRGRQLIFPENASLGYHPVPLAQVFVQTLNLRGETYPASANAHLIAAAPELLEACKTIIRAYENADVAPEALDRAYAGVAKAEGRS